MFMAGLILLCACPKPREECLGGLSFGVPEQARHPLGHYFQ